MFTVNPWTKKDGIITAMISLWFDRLEQGKKETIHVDQIIKFGFKKALVYEFIDDMIKQGLVESENDSYRTMKYIISPTPTGLTKFLKFYRDYLESIETIGKRHHVSLVLEIVRLKVICESLEKIQTSLFGTPSK